MSAVGLITEYNPFHNGHKHHLKEALRLSGCDSSIAVMSGSFTQRGEFAMADKYSRAAAAVSCGVDAVIELPTVFASGSALDFADGAVSMLCSTGVVSHIAFGVEDNEPVLFDELSSVLANEPEEYRLLLKDNLKSGLSYPAARSAAIKTLYGDRYQILLSSPNNTLGLQYLIALKKSHSDIVPILIPRIKSGYHDADLPNADTPPELTTNSTSDSGITSNSGIASDPRITSDLSIASASAIRNALLSDNNVEQFIPKAALKYLSRYFASPCAITLTESAEYKALILYLLQQTPEEELSHIMDCPDYLSQKIKNLSYPLSFEALKCALPGKNITNTRINRILIHLLLKITESDRLMAKSFPNGKFPYLNLLSFRKDHSELLHAIKTHSSSTLISKKSAYIPDTPAAKRLWDIDTNAHLMYAQTLYTASGIHIPSELSTGTIVVG